MTSFTQPVAADGRSRPSLNQDTGGLCCIHGLARFREAVPDIPLLVIAGADDISVREYEELGYQIIICAIIPVITTVDALFSVYQTLKETGFTGVSAEEVAERRKRVEELISLPEYYRIEAETTERNN